MKKILSCIIAFAMIISMSSVALAAGVAKIGTTEYDSLKAAADAAKSGDTLEIVAGTYGKTTGLESYGNCALVIRNNNGGANVFPGSENPRDLGNFTIEGSGEETKVAGIRISDYSLTADPGFIFGTLTIKDLTLTDSFLLNDKFIKADKIVFENVIFDAESWTSTEPCWVYIDARNGNNIGEIAFKNCTFKNGKTAQGVNLLTYVADNTEYTFENCSFDGAMKQIMVNKTGSDPNASHNGTITVADCTFTNQMQGGCAIRMNGIGGEVYIKNNTLDEGELFKISDSDSAIVTRIDPAPAPKPSRSGIDVTYNGGNSFSTSKSAVPTSVEIDGVEVPFTGNGKSFTVGCIDPNAEWVTVRWNSTSVTVNFKPDASVVCAEVAIPKTGDMPVWAAVLAFFGF